MAIRVLLVDDQTLIRRALQMLLADQSGVEVIGDADGGLAAIEFVAQNPPDVVLMDMIMPGMDGVEATKEICDRHPEIKVLILSIDDDQEYIIQAMRHGAAGYILKNTPPEELAFAIQAVHRGYTHLGPGVGEKMIAMIPDPTQESYCTELAQLTPREQDIARLIAQGESNQEIADHLFISQKTVKNHISSILSRLNLRDRTQIAIWALSWFFSSVEIEI